MTFRRDRERRSNGSALLPAASGSRLVSSRTASAGRALEKKTRGRISDGPQLGLRGPRALDLKDPPVPGRGGEPAASRRATQQSRTRSRCSRRDRREAGQIAGCIVAGEAMRWLADTDAGAAHGFARALCRARTVTELRRRTLAGLVEFVPADVLMWDRVELAIGVVRHEAIPADAEPPGAFAAVVADVAGHPLLSAHAIRRRAALRLSEASSLAACPTASCTAICSTRRVWSTPSRLALYPGVRAGFLAASSCVLSDCSSRSR